MLTKKVYKDYGENGAVHAAQHSHSGKITDTTHSLDQSPLTAAYTLKEHRQRQHSYWNSVIAGAKTQLGHRFAKHNQQEGTQETEEDCRSSQYGGGLRDSLSIAGTADSRAGIGARCGGGPMFIQDGAGL